jgi:hypothetical protein
MRPLIFLGINGVLTSESWLRHRDDPEYHGDVKVLHLDPLACQRLQAVCTATGAGLVLTSTWRTRATLAQVHEVFRQRGLTAPVIGRTPVMWQHASHFEWAREGTGLEIQWWLQHYLGDEATCQARFACLDDDHSRNYGDLLGKLVQTRKAVGLTDLECDYVLKHLREPLMDSAAAGGKGRVLFEHEVRALTPYWNAQEGPFGPKKETDGGTGRDG